MAVAISFIKSYALSMIWPLLVECRVVVMRSCTNLKHFPTPRLAVYPITTPSILTIPPCCLIRSRMDSTTRQLPGSSVLGRTSAKTQ